MKPIIIVSMGKGLYGDPLKSVRPPECGVESTWNCSEVNYPWRNACLGDGDVCHDPCRTDMPFHKLIDNDALLTTKKSTRRENVRATFYADRFQGRPTADYGAVLFDTYQYYIAVNKAYKELYPPGSFVRISYIDKDNVTRSVIAQVLDVKGKVENAANGIDCSKAVFYALTDDYDYHLFDQGAAKVTIERVEPEQKSDTFIRIEFEKPFKASEVERKCLNEEKDGPNDWYNDPEHQDTRFVMEESWELGQFIRGVYEEDPGLAQDANLVHVQVAESQRYIATGRETGYDEQYWELRIASLPDDPAVANEYLDRLQKFYASRGLTVRIDVLSDVNLDVNSGFRGRDKEVTPGFWKYSMAETERDTLRQQGQRFDEGTIEKASVAFGTYKTRGAAELAMRIAEREAFKVDPPKKAREKKGKDEKRAAAKKVDFQLTCTDEKKGTDCTLTGTPAFFESARLMTEYMDHLHAAKVRKKNADGETKIIEIGLRLFKGSQFHFK